MGRKLFIAAALLMLVLPVALAPLRADIPSYQANVAAANLTFTDAAEEAGLGAALTQWRDDLLTFAEEHLAFRTALITGRDKLLALIGESGNSQVVRGDGMLFYDEEMPDYLGRSSLPEDRLTGLADSLAELSTDLAAEGRRLIVLLAPNKSSVYPEAVPPNYLPSEQPSNLVRLQEALGERGVDVVDALSLLLAGKEEGRLYFANDTHWNARGAELIYRALMEALGWPVPYERIGYIEGKAGDLIVMAQPGTPPVEPDASPDIQRAYRTARPMRTLNDMRIETSTDADTLSLLVVRDSFGEGLFPYLANSVGRMVYSRVYEDLRGQAGQAEADVVVLEIVERNIGTLTP